MERRVFLSSLALLGAAVGMPWPSARSGTAATPVADGVRKRIALQTSPVAGFQYHEGEACWPELRIGDTLTLVREPTNSHDGRAVAVEWEGQRLGYVPRAENAAISSLLDRDEMLTANISALQQAEDPWKRVKLEVWLWV
jgi:hypothetical protein